MSGIPCDHACATIRRLGLDISNYIEDCFKLICQEMIYLGNMHPLVTHDMLVVHPDDFVCNLLGQILHSLTRRPDKRPRKHRIES